VNGIHEVSGSIPLGSTTFSTNYRTLDFGQFSGLPLGYQFWSNAEQVPTCHVKIQLAAMARRVDWRSEIVEPNGSH